MTLPELLSQLDQMKHQERMQVLDHLIGVLEQESTARGTSDEAVDESRWDGTFAKSQSVLSSLAARARQNRDQGLNRQLDPESL